MCSDLTPPGEIQGSRELLERIGVEWGEAENDEINTNPNWDLQTSGQVCAPSWRLKMTNSFLIIKGTFHED